MTNTAATLPLDTSKTTKFPNLRTGRMEIWEATSADGKFHFERIEEPGTPWVVTHEDFPGWSMGARSLPKARRYAEGQLALDRVHAKWMFTDRLARALGA